MLSSLSCLIWLRGPLICRFFTQYSHQRLHGPSMYSGTMLERKSVSIKFPQRRIYNNSFLLNQIYASHRLNRVQSHKQTSVSCCFGRMSRFKSCEFRWNTLWSCYNLLSSELMFYPMFDHTWQFLHCIKYMMWFWKPFYMMVVNNLSDTGTLNCGAERPCVIWWWTICYYSVINHLQNFDYYMLW